MSSEEMFTMLLRKLGLSPYEATAYTMLVKHGPLTASELGKITHIPQSRVYDVVSKLLAKGFIMSSGENPTVYRAVRPAIAVKAYAESMSKDIQDIALRATEIGEALRGSQPLVEDSRVWSTTSLSTTLSEMSSLISTAKTEILAALSFDAFQKLRKELEGASEKNVSICLVSYDVIPLQPFLDEQYEKRTRGPQMLIVDQQEVLIATRWGPEKNQVYTFKTNNPELMRIFVDHYLTVFRGMSKLIHTRFGVEVTERYFLYLQRAVTMIRELWRRRLGAYVYVKGVETSSYEPVEVSGIAKKIYIDRKRGITSLYLQTERGTLSIGGWGAYIEDIQANQIHVKGFPK